MLPLASRSPSAATLARLAELQQRVDAAPDFAARVAEGKRLWDGKTGSAAGRRTFADVRATLARMCTGPVRCHYCEDSAGDEIEHVRPKDLFPGQVFRWDNYLFACGPCNGPKGNRHAVLQDGRVEEIRRQRGAPRTPPPELPDALIDPRREDPREFLDLDLGGVSPNGLHLSATFLFLPRAGEGTLDAARAAYTIDVLGLNREVLVAARRNAFAGFRARLNEYGTLRRNNAPDADLSAARAAILSAPHLSVLSEMIRQADVLPFMQGHLQLSPEIADWPVVPSTV